VTDAVRDGAARLFGAAWELRRRAYAFGIAVPRAVPARVVSIGNLTVGGTGKTTLTLHLARRARAAGIDVGVVCRRYHPGPAGHGDEELLFAQAVGNDRVYAGRHKVTLAEAAARASRTLVLIDDGFSHWALARDVDVVLVDASDPWGGGRLLPAGRLREPKRALQRADVVVMTRLDRDVDADVLRREIARAAPAALIAGGTHERVAVRRWAPPHDAIDAAGPARLVTAIGNPAAAARSLRDAGFDPVTLSAYRDHHWFRADEAARERSAAARDGARLVLTAKDAVRWPERAAESEVAVLEVVWRWRWGGDEVEALIGLAGGTA
jgi:tetraacyldisaccharide 4'-kinase